MEILIQVVIITKLNLCNMGHEEPANFAGDPRRSHLPPDFYVGNGWHRGNERGLNDVSLDGKPVVYFLHIVMWMVGDD